MEQANQEIEVQDPYEELHQIAQRVIPLLERTAKGIHTIGEELLRAKALLPHGSFGEWHKDVLGLEKSTAVNFMHVAQRFKSATVALLAPLNQKSLYQLAAPSTPESAIDAVLVCTDSGQTPSIKEVEQIIKEHKSLGEPPDPTRSDPQATASNPFSLVPLCGEAALNTFLTDQTFNFEQIKEAVEGIDDEAIQVKMARFLTAWQGLAALLSERLNLPNPLENHPPALEFNQTSEGLFPETPTSRSVMQTMIERSSQP